MIVIFTIHSESKKKVAIFEVVLVYNMVDVVRRHQQLAKLHPFFSGLRLPTGHEPIHKLRSYKEGERKFDLWTPNSQQKSLACWQSSLW